MSRLETAWEKLETARTENQRLETETQRLQSGNGCLQGQVSRTTVEVASEEEKVAALQTQNASGEVRTAKDPV